MFSVYQAIGVTFREGKVNRETNVLSSCSMHQMFAVKAL